MLRRNVGFIYLKIDCFNFDFLKMLSYLSSDCVLLSSRIDHGSSRPTYNRLLINRPYAMRNLDLTFFNEDLPIKIWGCAKRFLKRLREKQQVEKCNGKK